MLQGKNLKDVEILGVKTMKLAQVNEYIARLDTGYGVDKFREIITTMYKNKGIDFETADWDLILCVEIKATQATKKEMRMLEIPLKF